MPNSCKCHLDPHNHPCQCPGLTYRKLKRISEMMGAQPTVEWTVVVYLGKFKVPSVFYRVSGGVLTLRWPISWIGRYCVLTFFMRGKVKDNG